MNRNDKLTALIEAAVMIAIAQVLSYIKVFEMPLGGSITAVSMLPIILIGFRRGAGWGCAAGLVYGILQFLLGPKWSFHPLSLMLDYFVAFAALGLSGFFKPVSLKNVILGSSVAVFGRFVCSFLAGVTIWAEYMPDDLPEWLAGLGLPGYSAAYNLAYLLPELILIIIVLMLVRSYLPRLMRVEG